MPLAAGCLLLELGYEAGASLYAFDGQGHQTVIDTVESSGTPGWSSVGSGIPFSYIVNNADEALEVRLDYGVSTNSSLRICGARIQYNYTLSRTSLPVILNESNP